MEILGQLTRFQAFQRHIMRLISFYFAKVHVLLLPIIPNTDKNRYRQTFKVQNRLKSWNFGFWIFWNYGSSRDFVRAAVCRLFCRPCFRLAGCEEERSFCPFLAMPKTGYIGYLGVFPKSTGFSGTNPMFGIMFSINLIIR